MLPKVTEILSEIPGKGSLHETDFHSKLIEGYLRRKRQSVQQKPSFETREYHAEITLHGIFAPCQNVETSRLSILL